MPTQNGEFTPPADNIHLRALTLADSDIYFDVFDENRAHLTSHDPHFADIHTLSQIQEMLAPYNTRRKQHFGIIRDDEFVGSAALLDHGTTYPPEITYWVGRHHLRQGIATYACRELVQVAFDLGHDEVEAFIVPTNQASIKTAERVGLRYNRTLENGLMYSIRK